MVARSTPDRKVACSSHVVVNFDDLPVGVLNRPLPIRGRLEDLHQRNYRKPGRRPMPP